jgi:hypothetical protein
MDVNALVSGTIEALNTPLALACVDNLKRYVRYSDGIPQGLQAIVELQEVKTTWHPIEKIGGATSTY